MSISSFRLSLVGGVVTALLCVVMVQPAAAEPEGQPCNPNGQVFAYGDVLDGCTIEQVSDLDIFQFAGSVGDTVTIILSRTGGPFGAFPCVELRDPGNNPVGSLTCGTIRLSPPSLPSSGIYHLIVTEQSNDQTVTFNLSLERLFPLRSPTPMGPGDVVIGREIMPVSDLDTFSFNGEAGDDVRIILSRTGGPFGAFPCLEVRAPDNSEVESQSCGSIDLPLSLTISGTYQLIVTEQSNDQTVQYNLSFNCLSGSCPNRPPSCFVDPSLVGNILTLDFTLGTAEPAQWHIALAALGTTFRLWTLPLPVLDPPIAAPFSIPGFPSLGRVGFLSTLTTAAGITCSDFKTVDTGGPAVEMTVHGLENLLGRSRQDK